MEATKAVQLSRRVGENVFEWRRRHLRTLDAMREWARGVPQHAEVPLSDQVRLMMVEMILERGRANLGEREMLSLLHATATEMAERMGISYSMQGYASLWKTVHSSMCEQVEAGMDIVEAHAREAFFVAAWERAGRNSYELELPLAELLLPSRTRLTGLHGDDLQLPFPAVYMEVPVDGLRIAGEAAEKSRIDGGIVGVGIVEDPHYFSTAAWRDEVERASDKEELGALLRDGRDGVSTRAWHICGCAAVGASMFTIPLDPRVDIAEYLQSEVTNLSPSDRDVFAFAMNAMVYATNVDGAGRVGIPLATEALLRQARAAKRERRRKIERRLADASREPHRILGMLETDRTVAEEDTEGEAPGAGSVLTVRTLVTGHWRRQVCGPRNTERKLIWIRPFWRGPDGAPWGQHSRRVLRAKALEKEILVG